MQRVTGLRTTKADLPGLPAFELGPRLVPAFGLPLTRQSSRGLEPPGFRKDTTPLARLGLRPLEDSAVLCTCVPEIHMVKPNLQGDAVRRPASRGDGLVPLRRRRRELLVPSTTCGCGQKPSQAGARALTSDFQPPEL